MMRSFFLVNSPMSVVRRYLVTSSPYSRSTDADSSVPPQIPQLTFSELKKSLKDSTTILIDVREKGELVTDGKIKESHHIPLGEVESAIQLDGGSFKKLYGFDKPSRNDKEMNLIIHCKAGVRAMKAAGLLQQAGYSNVRVYDGILDWCSNGGDVVKL